MKWAIVIAGAADFFRPPEKLSLTQNGALTATGLIWTRWCFVITPKNYLYVVIPPSSTGADVPFSQGGFITRDSSGDRWR